MGLTQGQVHGREKKEDSSERKKEKPGCLAQTDFR